METFEKKNIIKNIGWLTLSKILVYLLSIITITVVPRYLGVEAYGQLNFVLSFLGIFYILTDLGINTLIFRDVSKDKNKLSSYFNNFLLFKITLFILVSIIILLITLVLNKPLIVNQLFYLLIAYLFLAVIADFLIVFYNSMQENKFYAIYEFFMKFFYVLFLFIVIYFNLKLIGVFLAQLFSLFISVLIIIYFFKRYIQKIDLKYNLRLIKTKLYISWPFALNYLFYNVYFNFDKIFISLITNDTNVGLYSISYSFLGFIMAAVGLISLVFFPVLSKHSFSSSLPNIYNKYLKLVLLISVPMSLGAILLSKEIISLVFGVSYLGGDLPFKIIMFFCLIYSLNTTFNNLFSTHGYEKYFLKLLFIATISNVVLNIIIIPFLGIVGAALTTLLSEIIILIGSVIFIKRNIPGLKIIDNLIYPLFSGLLMVLGIFVIKIFTPNGFLGNNFDVLIYVLFGSILYVLSILLFRVIRKEDVKEVLSLIKK